MSTAERTALVALSTIECYARFERILDGLVGRKKNTLAAVPSRSTELKEINRGRYSSRCTYNRYEYQPLIKNYATLTADGSAATLMSDLCDSVTVKAPRGYEWQIDGDKHLMLVRKADGSEYHPSNADMTRGARHCQHMLLENVKLRKQADHMKRQAAKDEARFQVALPTLMVTYQDSRQAGNCEAGTRRFAALLGFDGDLNGKAVEADRILRLADRSGHRTLAERAVRAAWQRACEVCI